MTAVRKYEEVRSHVGGEVFEPFAGDKRRWGMTVSDTLVPPCTDWKCESPYGSVESATVIDEEGCPTFDRPVYREAPNVNVVAYGIGSDGIARFVVITQPRPHADDPECPGDEHPPVVFGQIVMGFLKSLMGADNLQAFESSKDGAIREIKEESSARVILDIEKPDYPWHNPNPTFVATWSELLFVRVDLDVIEKHRSTRGEPIFKAEFITTSELIRRVRGGKHEDAIYRMCTANSAWFIFFCSHPELFIP